MKPPFNLSDVVELGALPKIEILDIGAMIEGEALYATLMEQGLGSVTGFEPNPEELAKLKAQLHGDYRGLPDFLGSGASAELRVIPMAVSADSLLGFSSRHGSDSRLSKEISNASQSDPAL